MSWQFWMGVCFGMLLTKGIYLLTVNKATRIVRGMLWVNGTADNSTSGHGV